jgi:hypothetical protein
LHYIKINDIISNQRESGGDLRKRRQCMRKINLIGLPLGLFLVVALLVAALTAPAVLADTTPILCWGEIELDGAPAPVGTVITIYVGADTKASGSGMVTKAGQYGSIMVMADSSRYGEALTYKVNGFAATELGPDVGVFSLANQDVALEAVSGSVSTAWKFYVAGFHPKHLPDSYYGQVVLDNLVDVPGEVQGVYWFDDAAGVWKFWAPGAPGCTLATLGGGHTYDYMLAVSGPCKWDIPLQ